MFLSTRGEYAHQPILTSTTYWRICSSSAIYHLICIRWLIAMGHAEIQRTVTDLWRVNSIGRNIWRSRGAAPIYAYLYIYNMQEAVKVGYVFDEKRQRHIVGRIRKRWVYGHVVIFVLALQQFFLQLLYGTKSAHQEKALHIYILLMVTL